MAMDDLTGFKQPAEKDWRDNVYTGKNMPPESAQRELREKERSKGDGRTALGLLVAVASPLLLLALLGYLIWSAMR